MSTGSHQKPHLQIVSGLGVAGSSPAGPPRTLAVASGKGGVGKTSLSVNLALALAKMGQRVLVVDGDLGLGKVDVLLGARPQTNLSQYLSGQCDLDAVFQVGPWGVVFLAGGWGNGDLGDLDPPCRERLTRGLLQAATIFDLVLLDLPTGIGPNVLELARRADEVLMVTTPEPTAYADAYTLTKILYRTAGTIPRFVVNRARSQGEARDTYQRLSRTARSHFGGQLQYLGYLPEDPAVGKAVCDQVPFVLGAPDAPASQHIRALARRVIEERFPDGGDVLMDPRSKNGKAVGNRPQAA